MRIAPRLLFNKRRIPKHSGIHPKVNARIEADAKKYSCSKSFIIATILAEYYSVKDEGKFYVMKD